MLIGGFGDFSSFSISWVEESMRFRRLVFVVLAKLEDMIEKHGHVLLWV